MADVTVSAVLGTSHVSSTAQKTKTTAPAKSANSEAILKFADKEIKAYDTDKSGTLNHGEMINALAGKYEEETGKKPGNTFYKQAIKSVKDFFKSTDTNEDHAISKDELAAYYSAKKQEAQKKMREHKPLYQEVAYGEYPAREVITNCQQSI